MELFGTGEMERAHLVVWLSNHTRKPFFLIFAQLCVCVHINSAIRVVAKWVARNSTPTTTTTIGRIENVYRLTVTPLGDFLYGVALYAPSVCIQSPFFWEPDVS